MKFLEGPGKYAPNKYNILGNELFLLDIITKDDWVFSISFNTDDMLKEHIWDWTRNDI